jgi:PTH2 family peptidyl-tRNA hydrolase
MKNQSNVEITDDPIVMYLIVRESLGMSPGKLAAQCSHATQILLVNYFNHQLKMKDTFTQWLQTNCRKVVLSATEKDWLKLRAEFVPTQGIVVTDAGLTEIPSGSETVLGLYPMHKSQRTKILKWLPAL